MHVLLEQLHYMYRYIYNWKINVNEQLLAIYPFLSLTLSQIFLQSYSFKYFESTCIFYNTCMNMWLETDSEFTSKWLHIRHRKLLALQLQFQSVRSVFRSQSCHRVIYQILVRFSCKLKGKWLKTWVLKNLARFTL